MESRNASNYRLNVVTYDIDLRKLSMLVLTLLISNPLSKVYFLEKCGLPLCDGKIFLTRFKYLARSCKSIDPCGNLLWFFNQQKARIINPIVVLMKIKSAKIPPELSNNRLFWAFDHGSGDLDSSINFSEINIDILNDLRDNENLDNVPDPLSNVLGVTFEPVELLKIDRSHSPMTARSKNQPASTSRTHNIKIRDLSHESNTLREMNAPKEKYQNYLGNKYNKYTGNVTGNFDTSWLLSE